MKRYIRLMLGAKSAHIDECLKGNFIGADFDIQQDLSKHLYENWREFNKKFIPVWLETHPDKSKVSAGLACGALWTVAKGLKRGDIIISPDGMENTTLLRFWTNTVIILVKHYHTEEPFAGSSKPLNEQI